MSENNNGSSIWDNFSCHFPLCNLDGKEQKKKIVQTTSILVLQLFGQSM